MLMAWCGRCVQGPFVGAELHMMCSPADGGSGQSTGASDWELSMWGQVRTSSEVRWRLRLAAQPWLAVLYKCCAVCIGPCLSWCLGQGIPGRLAQ